MTKTIKYIVYSVLILHWKTYEESFSTFMSQQQIRQVLKTGKFCIVLLPVSLKIG